jgi:hypothetical protein
MLQGLLLLIVAGAEALTLVQWCEIYNTEQYQSLSKVSRALKCSKKEIK